MRYKAEMEEGKERWSWNMERKGVREEVRVDSKKKRECSAPVLLASS